MIKFKNIILITVIGLAVLFSGCAGTQETKVSETAKPTPAEQTSAVVQTSAAETPAATPVGPYQVQVTEVRTLQDCIVSGETKPCSLVNLEVKNNNVNSLDFQIITEEMVSSGGKLLGDRYDRDVGLSNLCVRQAGLAFKLNTNANQNVGMCYPVVHKSDTPMLKIAAMINGERKEYSFDLTKYGVTN
ncbi:MAG: hypothetical protein O8C63_13075 [Candidatus Methanoperedens sp.]|nr:hypothetical protein [Candidatus Methanoperedens sp.]